MNKDEAERLAMDLIYPDLRLGYVEHEKMLRTLTRALQRCAELAKAGGGVHQEGTEHIHSILD